MAKYTPETYSEDQLILYGEISVGLLEVAPYVVSVTLKSKVVGTEYFILKWKPSIDIVVTEKKIGGISRTMWSSL